MILDHGEKTKKKNNERTVEEREDHANENRFCLEAEDIILCVGQNLSFAREHRFSSSLNVEPNNDLFSSTVIMNS